MNVKRTVSGFLCAAALLSSGVAEANSASPTRISIPSGPGSIEGLGRNFAPSLASGTASYGVDIAVPPAAGGFSPHLALDYDGGSGVTEVGMGWHLGGVPRIRRRTENGLPRFDASDAFEVSGIGVASDLLEITPGVFRPEYESGAFVRVQRIPSSSGGGWEARTKAGVIYKFSEAPGFTEQEGSHIVTWLLKEQLDLHGHRIAYAWDTSGGYARLTGVTWNDFGDTVRNQIVLSYENRPDPHVLMSAGIKQTLSTRLTKIEVQHGGSLVRRYEVAYASGVHSRVASVDMVGRDGTSRLPRLSLTYTDVSFAANGQVTQMATPPGRSPSDPDVDLGDLDGDGLPDLLVTKAGAFRSYINHDGKSWQPGVDWDVANSPSVALSSTGVQLADADGDGAADLLVKSGVDFRYFPAKNATTFGAAVPLATVPNITFEDPDTKLADMDGDRRVDIVVTTAAGLAIGYNLGGTDWSSPVVIGQVDKKQALRFSDGGHTQLCDVNGDRVQDFCYLTPGSLVYWLGRGRGAFEPPQTASGVPSWDGSSAIAAWELHDLDGDGWIDLVHVGVNQVDFALGTAAGKFDAPKSISGTPQRGPNTTVRFADMNGSGTTDIVWIDVSGDPSTAWQYLELFPKGRAGLLSRADNGLGKVETIEYAPSGLDAAAARDANEPWTTRMNVPMPVVKRTHVDASLGDPVITVEYTYRDGTFSAPERTFAGFGGGTQRSIGDAYSPTSVEAFTYDVGVSDRTQRGLVLTHQMLDDKKGVFSITTNTYTSRTLESAGARSVHYTFQSSTKVDSVELGDMSQARSTLTEFEQDAYGNATAERHWGEIVGTDKLVGGDEQIVLRTYANNTTDWVLGRVASEETQNAKGVRVRMQRMYYDGAPFVGFPLGQVARGDMTRSDSWVGGDVFDLVTSTAFDADGNAIETKDGRGGGHAFSYDPQDRTTLLTETLKLESRNLTASAEVDRAFGVATSVTEFNGQTRRATLDPFGRLLTFVKPGDSDQRPTTRVMYAAGAPLSRVKVEHRVWNGRDEVEVSEGLFDGIGRKRGVLTKDSQGRWVLSDVHLYDARGTARRDLRARFVSPGDHDAPPLLADGIGVDNFHDAMGRGLRTRTQLGTQSRTEYAPFVTKFWDGAQSDPATPYEHTPTVETVDGLGRLVSRSSMLSGKLLSATFLHDASGDLTQKTDVEGNTSRYTYDGRGRRIVVDDPDAGKHTFVHDVTGNLVEHHRPDGVINRYTFDIAGRELTADWDGDGTPEVVRTWDQSERNSGTLAFGLLAKTVAPEVSSEVVYDERARIVKVHREIQGTSYDVVAAFDAQDREYWHQYPDGSSVRVYRDERGLVSSLGQAIMFDADADGIELRRSTNTGVVEDFGYDDDRRRREVVVRAGDAVLHHLKWSLDAASNLLSVTDARPNIGLDRDRSETYGYDNLYRLTTAKGTWGTATWTYSPSGNVVGRSSTVPSLSSDRVEYGGGAGPHAITQLGSRAIHYDARGRMKDDGARTLTWDGVDHLVSVRTSSGSSVDSIFDGDGMRRVRVEHGADGAVHTTHFIDDSCEVRDGRLVRYLVHGAKRLAELADGTGTPSSIAPLTKTERERHEEDARARLSKTMRGLPYTIFAVVLFCALLLRHRRVGRAAVAITFLGLVAFGMSACGGGHDDTPPPILEGSIKTLSDADTLLLDDAIGSLAEAVSGNGTTKRGTFAAYPYGLTRADTSTEIRKFADAPRDTGVGLDQMGARSYAPDLAVWASPDPALLELPERGLHAAFALGNAYGYAGGAPVHAVDRDGHWAVVVMAAIVVGVLLTCQYANAPESKSAPTFHKDDGDLALDMAHNSAIAYGVMSTAGGAVATAGEAGVGVAVVRTGSTVAQGAVAGTAVHGIADQVDPSGRVGKVADIAMVVQSAVPSKGIGARVGPATVAPEAPRTGTAGGPRAGKDFTVAGRRNVWKDNTTARGAPTCEGCERSVSKPLQSKKGITPPGDEGHVDHIVAKSKGGDGSPSNGALLCRDCNLKKSNK